MDSKTDLSRCANNVATVRSALVPGLMPFPFNAVSKAKSAGRSVAGCSVARNDLRNVVAVSRTSSAVHLPPSAGGHFCHASNALTNRTHPSLQNGIDASMIRTIAHQAHAASRSGGGRSPENAKPDIGATDGLHKMRLAIQGHDRGGLRIISIVYDRAVLQS
jgi:hypothetical protein